MPWFPNNNCANVMAKVIISRKYIYRRLTSSKGLIGTWHN